MKRFLSLFFLIGFFSIAPLALAQDASFHQAIITNVEYENDLVHVKALLVKEKREIEFKFNSSQRVSDQETDLKNGMKVVLARTGIDGVENFFLHDIYRLDALFWFFTVFVFVTTIVIGKRGLHALGGLGITLVVLVGIIAPLILKGYSPLLVSLVGALVIASISILVAHGFKKRTLISLAGIILTLGLSVILAVIAVSFTHLLGLGSEEAAFLKIQVNPLIDVRGILLGAIIIGTLGVLDDVATAQTATVEEIHKANKRLTFQSLYKRGMSVGKEHIISLVNTLVLAYVGAAFPIFLLLTTANPEPLWVTINAEFVSEEVVRMLVGSLTLVLAVPISTVIAAWQYSKGTSEKRCNTRKRGGAAGAVLQVR